MLHRDTVCRGLRTNHPRTLSVFLSEALIKPVSAPALTSLAMRLRASSSAVDLSFLVDLFRPVPCVPMSPLLSSPLVSSRADELSIIQAARSAVSSRLSCVVKC